MNKKFETSFLHDINFFTTYACNSRCLNCQIWKGKGVDRKRRVIKAIDLLPLYNDPLFSGCPNIGFAGGEPTISPFFWDILETTPEKKHITITTNALSSQKLLKRLDSLKDSYSAMIQVSIDGIGTVHDHLRGISGAYEKATNLLNRLKDLEIKRLVSFTINRLNYHQIKEVYSLAHDNGAGFSVRMAQLGGAYENELQKELLHFSNEQIQAMENSIDYIIDLEFKKENHSPAQLVFINRMLNNYKNIKDDIPCLAMETGLVIDLYGNVYPNCPQIMTPLGSLFDDTLTNIWKSKKAEEIRFRIEKKKCGGCWNDCQMVTNISEDTDFLKKEYHKLKLGWLKKQPLQKNIKFKNGSNVLLLDGWYGIEGDSQFRYRWTEPDFSIFVPKGTKGIEFFAMIPVTTAQNERVKINVVMGDTPLPDLQKNGAEWEKYRIDLQQPTEEIKQLHITFSKGYCPKTEKKSDDCRDLGMAIADIQFL